MTAPLTIDSLFTPTFTPTAEQQAIVAAARDTRISMMITAYAGCAKTTTLELIANVLPPEPALALAFNVKIKKELERRFPAHFTVLTLNGLGHRAWMRKLGRAVKINDKKLGQLVTSVSKAAGFNANSEQWDTIRRLVSLAMQAGLVPNYFPQFTGGLVVDSADSWQQIADDNWLIVTPVILDLARSVLIESIKLSLQGEISFDDQIYCSTMLGGVFPRFNLVLVDEAQDLSPLNHIQLKRVAADRIICCGDPKQAIYAFRGADSASMSKIRALRDKWIELPLATTFRCPKVIVTRQQQHASGFTAAPTNSAGKFAYWKQDFDLPLSASAHDTYNNTWQWSDIEQSLPSSTASIAILCRNNAPLLAMAFKLIRRQIGVVMLGRDIGKGLISLSKKIAPNDDTSVVECMSLINDWATHETNLARANDKEEKVAAITDRAECLIAVCESAGIADAGGLRNALRQLFDCEVGKVTLSTGHRAKGLEWDFVLHLDPWRLPSRYARQALQAGNPFPMEQEMNLRYVIETRTKHTLVLASLEGFE